MFKKCFEIIWNKANSSCTELHRWVFLPEPIFETRIPTCTGFGKDRLRFFHSSSYVTMFWICGQSTVDSTQMFLLLLNSAFTASRSSLLLLLPHQAVYCGCTGAGRGCSCVCSSAWKTFCPPFSDLSISMAVSHFLTPLSKLLHSLFYPFWNMWSQECHRHHWWAHPWSLPGLFWSCWSCLCPVWSSPGLSSQRPHRAHGQSLGMDTQ